MPRFIAESSLSASIKVVHANGEGEYEDLFNQDLIELRLARTTTFSDACHREFERLREEAEARAQGSGVLAPEQTFSVKSHVLR